MAAKSERRILITGTSGFIGSTCIHTLAGRKDYSLVCPSSAQMDITNKHAVEDAVKQYRPDTILNFAAHRNANTAEIQRGDEEGSAWMINVVGAKNLAEVCNIYRIYLLHVSTDMVFSGKETRKGPYSESDTPENDPNNLSWYGWTKRLAEQAVISNENACVVRIGNVTKPIYDPSLDYIGKIQWLYDTGNSYPLFHDQNITLTYIPELVDSMIQLIDARMSGVYHVASDNVTTPVELAKYLMSNVRPNQRSPYRRIS